jgi:hypothetical protein
VLQTYAFSCLPKIWFDLPLFLTPTESIRNQASGRLCTRARLIPKARECHMLYSCAWCKQSSCVFVCQTVMELKQVEQEKRREYEIGKYKQSIYDYPVKMLGLQPLDVPLPEYSTSMLPTGWRSEVSMHVNCEFKCKCFCTRIWTSLHWTSTWEYLTSMWEYVK